LGAHSNDELQRILAGKNVGASFSIGGDSFVLSGSTTPDDLELQLQLMVANLTDPGYRDEALRQFQKQLPALASQLKHTLAGPSAKMTEWLYGEDGRFAKIDPEVLATYKADDVRDWVQNDMDRAYLELSLVGDFDIETAIPMILATFGTLPERTETKPTLEAARVIAMPHFPAEKTFTYDSKIDKAVAIALWQTDPMGDNISEVRRMNILASITRDRLRKEIREELGSSYSPSARYSADQAFEVANFSVSSMATKETATQLQTAMRTIAEDIAAEGLNEDELHRALKPVLTELDLSLRQNGHWLNTILGRSQEKPITLEWARNRDADYRAITLEELEALASKYLQAGQAASISFLPEASE
jgi:zinc protease